MRTTEHDNSGDTKRFKASGEKGQSLFHTFIIEVAEKELGLIKDNYTRQLSYIERAGDDRLLAIVGALTVEDALDILLQAYIPEYKIFDDNGRISFYTKIILARSLKLIPAHLLEAATIIHGIRNQFAHYLHHRDFSSLPKPKKDGLVKIFNGLHPDEDANSYSASEIFSSTVSGLLVCFGVYASNLKLAKEYIYSDDFRSKIKEIVRNNSKG